MEQGLTAKALAERVGVSPSLISKIENDATRSSHDTLRSIATELHVSLGDMIDPESYQGTPSSGAQRTGRISVVRSNERKLLRLDDSGMTYQILTPDLQGAAEFVWLETEPGEGGKGFFAHDSGEECILVLEGCLHVYIEDDVVVLDEGDCLTFDARLPHRYANEGDERAVWVYIAVPPNL
jgi:transcriptional regulator with XRE-family HTH domain